MANLIMKVADLFQKREKKETSSGDISEFLTLQYIDHFLSGNFPEATPITNALNKHISLPKLGDHLIAPRIIYSHHGIYVGDEKVVHYSGFIKKTNSVMVSYGSIEEVSLKKFRQGKEFKVKQHPKSKFSRQEIVQRAKSRIGENNYALTFNNCEHFVNWCIYNVSESKQVSAVRKTMVATTIKAIGKRSPHAAIATGLGDITKFFIAYLKGDISKEKLFETVSHTSVTTTSAFYYAGLGQVAIPIPVVGALVGASVGYFVGNMLHQSGLIALGDSQIVREAKERREAVQTFCKTLVPEIKKSRIQLEQYIRKYFSDRKEEFEQAFNMLDNSLIEWNPDKFVAGLERINNQFGASLQFKTFDEFDEFMKSDETFKF